MGQYCMGDYYLLVFFYLLFCMKKSELLASLAYSLVIERLFYISFDNNAGDSEMLAHQSTMILPILSINSEGLLVFSSPSTSLSALMSYFLFDFFILSYFMYDQAKVRRSVTYCIVYKCVHYLSILTQLQHIMNKQKQYNIHIQQYHVKLKKNYSKILTLYPALNSTFVFLGMLGQTSVLAHCDKNGKSLYEYKFDCNVDSIGMVDLAQVIAAEPKNNQIAIFDLQSHEKITLPFQFLNEEAESTDIFTFSQTKYICIAQFGNYSDRRLRLTYFSGALNSESKSLAVYQTDSDWTYEYMVRPGNSHSMIVWLKARHDQTFEIKQFHLDGVNPKYNCYSTPNTIGVPYGKQKFQVAVSKAWQASPTSFCFVCLTEKSNYSLQNQKDDNNSNFIWDIQSNKIREAKFSFGLQYNQFLIDYFSIGQYSVFHTFSFHNGVAQPSPIFYVRNKEEVIVQAPKREWKCTYLVKFSFPGHEKDLYVESEYQNSEVSEFKMRIIKIQYN